MRALIQSGAAALSEDGVRLAEQSGLTLQRFIAGQREPGIESVVRLTVESPGGIRSELRLPEAILIHLASLLNDLGHGKQVAVLSTDTELTTQQAADVLNVSRPYLVKLLEEQQIPFRKVGARRRILLEDILRYKESEAVTRNQGLDELVAESQKLGLY
jgi:excisionase family DNA binding protein